MAVFAYIARDARGARVKGRVEAANEQAAVAEITAKGLAPVRVDAATAGPRGRRRVPQRAVALVYQQLADLLKAGVPLLRALRLLGRGRANPRLAAVLSKVADEVADGERFAESLARHPEIFRPVQVAMIRAGERGSFLEPVLHRLAVFLNHQADLRSKVLGSLVYPIVLLTMGTGIVVAALVMFVPKFRTYFSKMQVPLPTRILMGLSDLLVHWWPLLIVAAVVAGFLGVAAWRRPGLRRRLSEWQLRVPQVGTLVRSLAVARFTRVLGTLLENGIPMIQAMQISRDAAGHPVLAEAVERATEAVRAGESLARPLGESGFFEEDVVEMIAVGESANNLPSVLVGIADTVEARVDRTLAMALRLLEPLLLLFLAMVVLFIFMALVVPLMNMSSAV